MFEFVTTERQLLEGLLETLRGLPQVQAELGWGVQRGDPNRRYDAQVELRLDRKTTTLLIKLRTTLYPRDVRQEIWRIRESIARTPQSVVMLVAQSISPGAKDLLREERVGYYDSGGSLFLIAANFYVYVDKPPPKSMSIIIRSLYSGRRAQVLVRSIIVAWEVVWRKGHCQESEGIVSDCFAGFKRTRKV